MSLGEKSNEARHKTHTQRIIIKTSLSRHPTICQNQVVTDKGLREINQLAFILQAMTLNSYNFFFGLFRS